MISFEVEIKMEKMIADEVLEKMAMAMAIPTPSKSTPWIQLEN